MPYSDKRDLEALLRMECRLRAALAKIEMRLNLRGMASGEACEIVTRTRLKVLRSLGDQRQLMNARADVGNRSVGQNREIRGCGRHCSWKNGEGTAKPC
jgi:hypothetical protein